MDKQNDALAHICELCMDFSLANYKDCEVKRYMACKEWLLRAWEINDEINMLIEEQENAFLRATYRSQRSDSEKVQSSKTNTAENRFTNYAEYAGMIDAKIDELYSVKREIVSAIWQIDDNTLRKLLFLRYIRFRSWEQIAESMHYSYKHVVHILHPKALQKIIDMQDEKTEEYRVKIAKSGKCKKGGRKDEYNRK